MTKTRSRLFSHGRKWHDSRSRDRKEKSRHRHDHDHRRDRDYSHDRGDRTSTSQHKEEQPDFEHRIREAEKSKARIFELPGKSLNFDKSFLHSIMVDEKYKMVASHVDPATRRKIENFKYVDLAKLLPRDKVLQQEDQRLTFVNKGGQPWIVPVAESQTSEGITSYMKWHLAFRVFLDILTAKYPEKAQELFQYEHVIYSASQTFIWDNVYSYDKAFRVHISEFPNRTWSIILQQAYSNKLKEKVMQ